MCKFGNSISDKIILIKRHVTLVCRVYHKIAWFNSKYFLFQIKCDSYIFTNCNCLNIIYTCQ